MLQDNYKGFCVYKAFDVDKAKLRRISNDAEAAGVDCDIATAGGDTAITLGSTSLDYAAFAELLHGVYDMVEDCLYADSDLSLAKCLVDTLRDNGLKLGVAESVTGGLICSEIVAVAGSSDILHEGFVVYSEASKVRRLHVKLSDIEDFGIVSDVVAKEMVEGVLASKDVDVAISTTGCAGPGSDDYASPVGLCYIGYGKRGDVSVEEAHAQGSRNENRLYFANKAMYNVLKNLKNGRYKR